MALRVVTRGSRRSKNKLTDFTVSDSVFQFVKIILTDGKPQKKTVFVNENGEKYVYVYRGYMKLADFLKDRKTV